MDEKTASELFTPEELRAGLLSPCAVAGKIIEYTPSVDELEAALDAVRWPEPERTAILAAARKADKVEHADGPEGQ